MSVPDAGPARPSRPSRPSRVWAEMPGMCVPNVRPSRTGCPSTAVG